MQMNEGLDTGDVLAMRDVNIDPGMTAGELSEILAGLGGTLIREELIRFLAGSLTPELQDEADATYASLLSREHGVVSWEKSAVEVHNHIRGFVPWPGASTTLAGHRLKLHRAHVDVRAGAFAEPGSVLRADGGGIKVACGQGVIVIDELQLQGRKRMTVEAFLPGRPVGVGEQLG
jgi:methionyl-tRNA formyltransferase